MSGARGAVPVEPAVLPDPEPDPDPMPMFTIKAKDALAVAAVVFYRQLCLQNGLVAQAAEVDRAIAEIQHWRQRHPHAIQAPDHRHVPVSAASEHEQAIDVAARQVVAAAVLARAGEMWEDYPEIGEHDWQRIVERAGQLAAAPDPDDYQRAHALLDVGAGDE